MAGERLGTVYVEVKLDSTKMERQQVKLLSDIKKIGVEGEAGLTKSFSNLGVKTDQIYQLMANKAVKSYERITASANVSAAEQFRAQAAMIAKVNALNMQMTKNPLYETLGIRSVAAINAQKTAIIKSFDTITQRVKRGSNDWIRIEKAKNVKLNELNQEMAGQHKASYAGMARAMLRLYAAYYVLQAVIRATIGVLSSGIKAIDELKISTIAVAAQITTMQGPKNVVENYKKAIEYAHGLNIELMKIDAISFANYQQIQLMNRAMNLQGVLLDTNNRKQVESFTALTNAVAMFTQGQDKQKQASQEIRALMSGEIRAGNMLARVMDEQIKRQGEYKGGLKEVLKLGKQHGDTLERMQPYLIGIVAAAGDIQMTWESVASSFETAWGIVERALFKDIYKKVTADGRAFTTWMMENADQIADKIKEVYETIKRAVQAVIAMLVMVQLAAWKASYSSGAAAAWWAAKWEAAAVRSVLAINKVWLALTGLGTFIVGWEIGKYLSDKFDFVRKAGVAMVAGIMAAWDFMILEMKISFEYVKLGWATIKSPFNIEELRRDSEIAINILKFQYEVEKQLREDRIFELFGSSGKPPAPPEIPPIKVPDIKGSGETIAEIKAALTKKIDLIKEEYDTKISEANRWLKQQQHNGINELFLTKEMYKKKTDLLFESYTKQESLINKSGIEEEDKTKRLAKLHLKYTKDKNNNDDWYQDSLLSYSDKHLSTMANLYKTIDQYSDNSINAQIEQLKRKYREDGRYTDDTLALAKALKVEENKLYEDADKYWADYYSKIDGYADLSYQKKLDWIEKIRQKEIAAANAGIKTEIQKTTQIGAANTKANEAIITAIGEKFDQDNKYTNQVITNAGSMLDAAMTMYDKDSSEYKRLSEWKKAVQIAELAMTAAKNIQLIAGYLAVSTAASGTAVANAGAAVTGAAIGVGPTGFATAAAMIALMASVFAMYGIANGGGGVSVSAPILPPSTVLGANAETGNESIQNSFDLLQDTYDMEYRELSGIHSEMKNLNTNISGLVASIFRTGGIDSSYISTGTTLGGMQNLFDDYTDIKYLGFGDIVNTLTLGISGWIDNAISNFVGSIFGGGTSTSITGSGISTGAASIRSLAGGGGIGSQQYTDVHVHEEGGWFSSDSDSYYTAYQALNSNVSNLLDKVFQNMSNTLIELTLGLGTDMDKTLNYVFSGAKISLQGMDSETINKTLTEYFAALGDNAVEALFGNLLGTYQQVGEGLMETATRILIDKAVVLDTLSMTGQAFSGTIPQIIAFSEAIINMAGDLETLRENAETYYDKFFTDEEKQLRLQNQLTGALSDINMNLPIVRDGYRDLVEGLNLTTTAGQEAYVSLLAWADSADEYYSTLEDAEEAAASATANLISELESLSKTIDEWLASLRISDLSPVLSEASYQAEYTKMITAAKATGATPEDVTDFLNYATQFLTYEKSYGTASSYQAIYDAVVADVMALQAQTMTTLASYDTGTNYVPKTGPYTLHEGEIVIPRNVSDVARSSSNTDALGKAIAKYILQSDGGSNGETTINIPVNIDGREIGNVVAKQAKTNPDLQESIRRLN